MEEEVLLWGGEGESRARGEWGGGVGGKGIHVHAIANQRHCYQCDIMYVTLMLLPSDDG